MRIFKMKSEFFIYMRPKHHQQVTTTDSFFKVFVVTEINKIHPHYIKRKELITIFNSDISENLHISAEEVVKPRCSFRIHNHTLECLHLPGTHLVRN